MRFPVRCKATPLDAQLELTLPHCSVKSAPFQQLHLSRCKPKVFQFLELVTDKLEACSPLIRAGLQFL